MEENINANEVGAETIAEETTAEQEPITQAIEELTTPTENIKPTKKKNQFRRQSKD